MFQEGDVESSFMFSQENGSIKKKKEKNGSMMVCDMKKVFTEFSFGLRGE